MPRTIHADGRTITVPDDATPEEINQIVGPAPSSAYSRVSSLGASPGFWARYDASVAPLVTPTPHNLKSLLPGKHGNFDPKAYLHEGETALSNVGAGALGVALHPLNTVGGILKSAVRMSPPVALYDDLTTGSDAYREMAEQSVKAPLETAETMLGQTAALGGGTELVKGVGRFLPKAAGRILEAATGTGPRETANLVKETRAANETAAENAADKNSAQEAKRKIDLSKHFEKTQATKAANTTAEAAPARKVALERGVEHLEPELKTQLEATEEKVNTEANRRYNELDAQLKMLQADPEAMRGVVANAAEKITGSETDPTILKDMEKRLQRDDQFTYEDLQGYRSELGRELRKGTLPGDVYHSYKTLQDAITTQMEDVARLEDERMAQETGKTLPKEQTYLGRLQAARAYYRQYAETFLDRDSPVRKAIDTGNSLKRKPGDVVAALRGRGPAVEALARYNPELAGRVNTITGYQTESKALPSKPGKIASLPKLAPKPESVVPEVKTVGSEESRGAKAGGLQSRADWIRNRGRWAASWPVFYALKDILHGNPGGIPGAMGEAAATAFAVNRVARFLENPKVVEFLTRPTARDVAEIPPDMRGDIGQLAQAALKKGIKVDPRLYAVAGAAAPRKRIGDILPKVHPALKPTENTPSGLTANE